MSKYPLHEKMQIIPEDERQLLGEFLEWFGSNNSTYGFMKRVLYGNQESWMPCAMTDATINTILGEYYGVPYDELQKEKERMLAEVRLRNTLADIEKIGDDDHQTTRD